MAGQLGEFVKIISERSREKVPENIQEKIPLLHERYNSRDLVSEDDIRRARQLATVSFVKLGKIDGAEVADGILVDDAVLDLSTFFATFDRRGTIQASARLLWKPDVTIHDLRLPLDQIDAESAAYLLDDHDPGTIAEIGSFAKKDRSVPTVATLKLLRSMWAFADDNGVETFVCGLEPKLYPSYQALFGEALTPLSDGTVEFPGIHGQQKPLMIDVRRAVVNQRSTQGKSLMEGVMQRVVGPYITRDAKGVMQK